MANLEGLMKDLNAITASEFECWKPKKKTLRRQIFVSINLCFFSHSNDMCRVAAALLPVPVITIMLSFIQNENTFWIIHLQKCCIHTFCNTKTWLFNLEVSCLCCKKIIYIDVAVYKAHAKYLLPLILFPFDGVCCDSLSATPTGKDNALNIFDMV